MNSRDVRKRLSGYLAGEGPCALRNRLRHHLRGCAACEQEAAAERRLLAAMESIPARQVGDGWDSRLYARLAEAAAPSPVRGWSERLTFRLGWRLRPVLGAAAAAVTVVGIWVALPGRDSPGPAAQAEPYLTQHRVLVEVQAEPEVAAEQEVVDYSIAHAIRGSAFETY